MTTPAVPTDAAMEAAQAFMRENQPGVQDGSYEASPMQRSGHIEEPASDVYPQQEDYFGFSYEERWLFPDGATYVILKKLNEGDRKSYLNKSNRKLSIRRSTGDAELNVAAGDEKHHLLKTAIIGWNLVRQGHPIPFNSRVLEDWLGVANPALIDDIEAAIHNLNPWLDGDISIEDIDKEIERLGEVRARKVAEEEGKDTSER